MCHGVFRSDREHPPATVYDILVASLRTVNGSQQQPCLTCLGVFASQFQSTFSASCTCPWLRSVCAFLSRDLTSGGWCEDIGIRTAGRRIHDKNMRKVPTKTHIKRPHLSMRPLFINQPGCSCERPALAITYTLVRRRRATPTRPIRPEPINHAAAGIGT